MVEFTVNIKFMVFESYFVRYFSFLKNSKGGILVMKNMAICKLSALLIEK